MADSIENRRAKQREYMRSRRASMDPGERRRSGREQNRRWRHKNPKRQLVIQARQRAKRKGILCTIEPSDFEIPEVCPVLGIPLACGPAGQPIDSSPTLDRLIPDLGYVPGNVFVISNRANKIKSDASLSELQSVVRWVREKINGR